MNEEEEFERIKDEGFDLLSHSASKEELLNFFEKSKKKLSRPSILKQFEDYKLALEELDEILH